MTLSTALMLSTAAIAQPGASTEQAAPRPLKSVLAPPVGRDPHESRATMGPRVHDRRSACVPSRISIRTHGKRCPKGAIASGRQPEGERGGATATCNEAALVPAPGLA